MRVLRSTEPVRVLHVITGLTAGGAEVMLHRLARRMDRERFDSAVVSLTDAGIYGVHITAAGVPVHVLGMARGRPSPRGLARLARLIGTIRPAIVQGWMYHSNVAVALATRLARLRTPVLWNVRASLRNSGRDKLATALAIRAGAPLSRGCTGIIYNAVTSARQHEAIGYAAARACVIPNGFDCDEFKPDPAARQALRAELGVAADEILVGCFGRDDPMKDHPTFIAAARRAIECVPQLRFVIAGEGMDAANAPIVRMLADAGMSDRIGLLGERTDMPRLNAALDIACLTSAWGEGFPNVLGEAMACGVPCVTTDTGDSRDIVGDTGHVTRPRDTDAIAGALVGLARSAPEARQALGVAARRRVRAHYSIDAIVRAYEHYYESIGRPR